MSAILVIEDSPSIALLLRRRLTMEGHEVEVSATGTDALDRIDPDDLPDIVLADVVMPGPDGLETVRRIKSRHPGLPAVLVTAQEIEAAGTGAADAVVRKPIDFDELFALIERLTAGAAGAS